LTPLNFKTPVDAKAVILILTKESPSFVSTKVKSDDANVLTVSSSIVTVFITLVGASLTASTSTVTWTAPVADLLPAESTTKTLKAETAVP